MKDTPMEVEERGMSNQLEYMGDTSTHVKGNMSGMSNLAKFKAAQDLRIQTQDLPEKNKTSRTLRRSGSSSSSGTLSAPNTNASSASTTSSPSATSQSCTTFNERDIELDGEEEEGEGTPETPLPPSSTGKKRRRRTANQIDRKFACSYPGCAKAYGSEGSLTQHQRLKHRVDLANPSNQTGNFFLPLHRARNAAAAAAATNHAMYRQAPGMTRTVNIRPALDGMMMAPFEASVAAAAAAAVAASTGSGSVCASVPTPVSALTTTAAATSLPIDDVSTKFLLTSVDAHSQARQSLRARSNSMPVSSSGPTKVEQSPYSNRSKGSSTTPRPQSTRRSRMNCTPRARTATAATASAKLTKRRSKSESLAEISMGLIGTPQQQQQRLIDDGTMRLTFPERVYSDTTSPHASFGVDIHAKTILAPSPFDWTSIDMHGPSRDSSSEEAIDSDILCVLADYDDDDTVSNRGDTLGIVRPADGFQQSVPFSEMDGMLSSEPLDGRMGPQNGVGMTPPVTGGMAQRGDPSLSPHGGPGQVAGEGNPTDFLRVADDWQYLSTHLEKMTMLQEPESMITSATFTTNAMDPFPLEIMSEDDDETLHTVRTTRGVYLPIYPQTLSRSLSNALMDDSSSSPLWTKEPSTSDMEASMYMDDVDLTTFAALKADNKALPRPLSPMYTFAKSTHPLYDRQISLGSVGSVGSLGGMSAFAADSSLFNSVDGMDCMEDVRI